MAHTEGNEVEQGLRKLSPARALRTCPLCWGAMRLRLLEHKRVFARRCEDCGYKDEADTLESI